MLGRMVDLQSAFEDRVITGSEIQAMTVNTMGAVFSAVVIAFGMMCFYKVVGGGGSGSSSGKYMTEDIAERAGLNPYKPPPMWALEEREPSAKKRKPPMSTRTRTIGQYEIIGERRPTGYTVKLYENLPNWQRKLRATQTAENEAEYRRLFDRVVDTVIQVRFEDKTQMRR